MNVKRKAAILGVLLLLALLFTLPAARDELNWRLAESRDQAVDYQQYLDDWPKGRHRVQARERYEQSVWDETKRAMIADALKKHAASRSTPEAIEGKKHREERFFWKQVALENTLVSYKDYLQRFPDGEFAAEARRRIDALSRAPDAGGTNAPNP